MENGLWNVKGGQNITKVYFFHWAVKINKSLRQSFRKLCGLTGCRAACRSCYTNQSVLPPVKLAAITVQHPSVSPTTSSSYALHWLGKWCILHLSSLLSPIYIHLRHLPPFSAPLSLFLFSTTAICWLLFPSQHVLSLTASKPIWSLPAITNTQRTTFLYWWCWLYYKLFGSWRNHTRKEERINDYIQKKIWRVFKLLVSF